MAIWGESYRLLENRRSELLRPLCGHDSARADAAAGPPPLTLIPPLQRNASTRAHRSVSSRDQLLVSLDNCGATPAPYTYREPTGFAPL
jgi:hypothetical protein